MADAPPEDARLDTETAKANDALRTAIAETEDAARNWGVQPDRLEGKFVSALLGTLTWLGRLMHAAVADLKASSSEARAVSALELEKLHKANELSRTVLAQARSMQAGAEMERQAMIGKFVEASVPQLTKALGAAVVIRERDHNVRVRWLRALTVAGIALALFIGGQTWGGRHSAADIVEGATAVDRINRCAARPLLNADKEPFCRLRDLLSPG